jgi:nucleoside-diphosphate-sugar epimerase
MNVLVTGAQGFVGRRLVERLAGDRATRVRGSVRRDLPPGAGGVEWTATGDLAGDQDWRQPLEAIECVVHLAARVHVMRDRADDPLGEFRRANVDATLNLATQAAVTGVKRLVFVSSVKVNGDSGVFSEVDAPVPAGPYGISKHEAEAGLRRIADETGLEVVIIRPPLVYGPGVKGNFRQLIRAVAAGVPLPLATVDNRRSLIGLDNLVDVIRISLDHPAAANETFLVSDGEDCSTSELIRRLAQAMRRPARLIPFPTSLLMQLARLAGCGDAAGRLLDSLQVNIAKARQVLGWTPPISLDEGLRRAVAADQ